jgi:hypothetical protein
MRPPLLDLNEGECAAVSKVLATVTLADGTRAPSSSRA